MLLNKKKTNKDANLTYKKDYPYPQENVDLKSHTSDT